MEQVVLVDEQDRPTGYMEKLEAHKKGLLHRAVSVCLFDKQGRWLIQQRATSKYHSPGLYANSCCSHPRKGESPKDAAERRVYEELGIHVKLRYATSFIYRADVGSGLIEHEYDHLFIGKYDGAVDPNPNEVSQVVWWSKEEIEKKLKNTPEIFAGWFKEVFFYLS